MFFVHNNPEAVDKKKGYAHAPKRGLVLRRIRVTPLGFCLWIIVNEKPSNLEKTTSSVLSVIVN